MREKKEERKDWIFKIVLENLTEKQAEIIGLKLQSIFDKAGITAIVSFREKKDEEENNNQEQTVGIEDIVFDD